MTWTILPAGTSASIAFRKRMNSCWRWLHVAADDGPVEDVERSEQGRGATALVVVRHGAEPALLQRQGRLGAIYGMATGFDNVLPGQKVSYEIDMHPVPPNVC
jgi:hypothetical protein